MKTTEQTAANLRALIRWTTGAIVTIAIPAGACMLFPLLSSLPALALTGCLSLFIGLNIALPPLDPEDDWVPIHPAAEEEAPVAKPATAAREEPVGPSISEAATLSGIEVLPIHRRRSSGAPSGTWNVYHPAIEQNGHTHGITLGGRKQINLDGASSNRIPATRKG